MKTITKFLKENWFGIAIVIVAIVVTYTLGLAGADLS